MVEILYECRENFGKAPRKFSLWDRLTYLRMPRPIWLHLNPRDGLRTLFERLPDLFETGIVVWGHIVQANRMLFSKGSQNLPGEFVFCLDAPETVDINELQDVAMQLGELKGTKPRDRNLRPIADHLTDEYTRVFGVPIPQSLTPNGRYELSTTHFFRKHLPLGKICRPLLPLIVSRSKPRVVLPLPARYWPDEFLEWWVR